MTVSALFAYYATFNFEKYKIYLSRTKSFLIELSLKRGTGNKVNHFPQNLHSQQFAEAEFIDSNSFL